MPRTLFFPDSVAAATEARFQEEEEEEENVEGGEGGCRAGEGAYRRRSRA